MVPVIKTGRLVLRPWRVEDAPAMFAYAKDPDVGPNAGWKPHESVEESRERCEKWAQGEDSDWLWAITEKGRDLPIGSVGLHEDRMRLHVPGHRKLGYVLGREFWGRGYMTEAVNAVLDHAFVQEHLKLVSVGHYTFNARSRRVIEKCGFHFEGELRMATVRYDGLVPDGRLYSMTAAEYWLRRARRLGLSLTLPEELPLERIQEVQNEWGKEHIVPGLFNRRDMDAETWLQYVIANRLYARKPYVTSDLWILTGADGGPLGALALRHRLNEELQRTGGHIGYGLRPEARGKKLAPCMLALGLEKAKERGIDRVLVTCDEDNPASAKTIEACGGVYENSLPEDDGNLVRRYWISV